MQPLERRPTVRSTAFCREAKVLPETWPDCISRWMACDIHGFGSAEGPNKSSCQKTPKVRVEQHAANTIVPNMNIPQPDRNSRRSAASFQQELLTFAGMLQWWTCLVERARRSTSTTQLENGPGPAKLDMKTDQGYECAAEPI